MTNKYYTIFYKTENNATLQHQRSYLSYEECEKLCQNKKYIQYNIVDLSSYTPTDLHILTDVTYFDGKYYFTEEIIPYPESDPKNLNNFDVSMVWEDEENFYEGDYDDVYNGVEQLWTNVITKFSVNKNMEKLGIVAQGVIHDFPVFLEKLENNKQAVYHNEEYSPFKWLAWIKNNKVRLIHQDYRFDKVNTEFDILMDKELFYQTGNFMLKTMNEYANRDLKRYNKYVAKKYKEVN